MSDAGGSRDNFGNQGASNEDIEDDSREKKPFDKRKWRDQHYSFKSKLDQHADRRKKAVVRNYHKVLQREGKTVEHTADHINRIQGPAKVDVQKKRFRELEAAKAAFMRRREEQQAQFAIDREQRNKNREAVAASRVRRTERFKKVSAKTRNGQPVMRGRLQLMLQEIEQKFGNGQ